MAFVLKAGRTFAHPFSEVPISTAYAIVDDILINKKGRNASFNLLVFINRNARLNNKQHLHSFPIVATDTAFDTYFSPALPTTIWAQANSYLAAPGVLASIGLVATDWQVDGQAEP